MPSKERFLRVSPSIGTWLPLLKDFLSSLVILEEKAVELYHFSLLEKPASSHRSQEVVIGVAKGGRSLQKLHDHLVRQGFEKRVRKTGQDRAGIPVYFRGDLGMIQFTCAQTRPNQKSAASGLAATPDKRVSFLLESPHAVEVPYLGEEYEVWVPQVGRFILDKGLQLSTGRNLDPDKVYGSARGLMMILDLLVSHDELQEEVVNDIVEIRPPGLVREFLENLKHNGPGTVLWDSAQKLYLERHPGVQIVALTRWYWKFLPYIARVISGPKED
jgi:hypothetical protein